MPVRINQLANILGAVSVVHGTRACEPPLDEISFVFEVCFAWGEGERPFAMFLVCLPFAYVDGAVVGDQASITLALSIKPLTFV